MSHSAIHLTKKKNFVLKRRFSCPQRSNCVNLILNNLHGGNKKTLFIHRSISFRFTHFISIQFLFSLSLPQLDGFHQVAFAHIFMVLYGVIEHQILSFLLCVCVEITFTFYSPFIKLCFVSFLFFVHFAFSSISFSFRGSGEFIPMYSTVGNSIILYRILNPLRSLATTTTTATQYNHRIQCKVYLWKRQTKKRKLKQNIGMM